MKVLPVYRCVTVSANVTVMLASVLLIVHSLEAEAVTIATQPRFIRYVSRCSIYFESHKLYKECELLLGVVVVRVSGL